MALMKHQTGVALREAERAIDLSANDVDALKAQAEALIYSGRYAEAIELANRIIRLDPAFPAESLYLVGMSHFALGDYEKSIDYIERALKYDPTTSEYAGLLAAAYGKLGIEKQARESWLKYKDSWLIKRVVEPRASIADAVYRFPFQDGEVLKTLADGFEAAGAFSSQLRYLVLDRDTRLSDPDIESVVFGQTISGLDFWNANEWTQTRTTDGKVSHSGQPIHTGSYDSTEGESWVENNLLCDRWPMKDQDINTCVAIFRDSDGGENNYYMVTDQGPHPFRRGLEMPEKYHR
jgi:tetratricopeptide (TPR) repeat protein